MPADPKKKAPRKPPPRGKRSRDVKDPVERTDRYVTGTAVGEHSSNAQRAALNVNRLKELIMPVTEDMVKVMIDIAKDEKVHASIRMECADRLLSRAYGKPKEHVQVEDVTPAHSDGDVVMGLLNNILSAVGAPLLEAPGEGS